MTATGDPRARAASLPIWRGPVAPEPLGGGITNTNFLVRDGGRRYVVRVGEDIPVHGVMRFNELAASRAAHAAGISPAVVHAEPGILVLEHIEGRTLEPEDVRARLEQVVALVHRAHHEIPRHLRGPALVFWVFHVVRDYAHTLEEGGSRLRHRLPEFLAMAERLEKAVGAIELVYGHNDLLAANLIDDGSRLWLIDWDYAGFNTPLFDLGGLSSNCDLDEASEKSLLEQYFDGPISDEFMRRYLAMKCASLLRETMWSMVSELTSSLEIDFADYTRKNLARFRRAFDNFQQS